MLTLIVIALTMLAVSFIAGIVGFAIFVIWPIGLVILSLVLIDVIAFKQIFKKKK